MRKNGAEMRFKRDLSAPKRLTEENQLFNSKNHQNSAKMVDIKSVHVTTPRAAR